VQNNSLKEYQVLKFTQFTKTQKKIVPLAIFRRSWASKIVVKM